MSVNGMSGISLQSAMSTYGSGSVSETTDTFSDVLSDALSSLNSGGEDAYEQTYDMYTELLGQSSDTTDSLLAVLMSAGMMNASPTTLMSLCSALTGQTSVPCTDRNILPVTSQIADTTAVGTGEVTASPWNEASPAVISDAGNRSAALYTDVIGQFGVETNPRYAVNQQGNNDTYCNIFVWDVTSAMSAEIPHYYNAETGEPMSKGDDGTTHMTANRMDTWLHEYGENHGWHEVSAEEAQALANQGHPVVTSLYRDGKHGHVQVVCPSKDGEYSADEGVTVAQAGRNLTSYTHISNIYDASLSKVSYFAHI